MSVYLKKTLRHCDPQTHVWSDMPCLVPVMSYKDWSGLQVWVNKGHVGWYCLFNNGDIVPPRPVAEVWKAITQQVNHSIATACEIEGFVHLVAQEMKAGGHLI